MAVSLLVFKLLLCPQFPSNYSVLQTKSRHRTKHSNGNRPSTIDFMRFTQVVLRTGEKIVPTE